LTELAIGAGHKNAGLMIKHIDPLWSLIEGRYIIETYLSCHKEAVFCTQVT